MFTVRLEWRGREIYSLFCRRNREEPSKLVSQWQSRQLPLVLDMWTFKSKCPLPEKTDFWDDRHCCSSALQKEHYRVHLKLWCRTEKSLDRFYKEGVWCCLRAGQGEGQLCDSATPALAQCWAWAPCSIRWPRRPCAQLSWAPVQLLPIWEATFYFVQ